MKSHRFKVGDHLCSLRTFYTHHGIYLGHNEVIHYASFASEMSKGSIEITSLSDFCQGQDTRVIKHPNRRWNVEETTLRAYKRLGEDWYNLLVNNCEHFVYWCIEGTQRSPQVEKVANWTLSGLAYASVKRQSPTILRTLVARTKISTVISPAATSVSTSVATSLVSSAVTPNLVPALAKAVANSTLSAAAASSVGYGGAAALAGVAGIATAPVSVPIALAVGTLVGLFTFIKNRQD
ncbi:MAG: lecithin retinol acyltransferase family protein [Pseudomonadota bacterium]